MQMSNGYGETHGDEVNVPVVSETVTEPGPGVK